jgi:hypothetical protein
MTNDEGAPDAVITGGRHRLRSVLPFWIAACALAWGCGGAVPSQFDAGFDDGAAGTDAQDDGSGDSSGGSSGSSGGTCNLASCKACVLGTVSCTSAGACQCCLRGTCLPD